MEWRHGTWQCPRCRFKLGCCEGDPQTNCDARPAAAPATVGQAPADADATQPAARP